MAASRTSEADESKARKNREAKNGVQPRTRIGQERRSVALHLQCSACGELRVLPRRCASAGGHHDGRRGRLFEVDASSESGRPFEGRGGIRPPAGPGDTITEIQNLLTNSKVQNVIHS